MPITLHELARLANVSHTTVSLVLRGKDGGRVSEKKRTEILELVRQHNYRPNAAAQGLAQGCTYRIAICIHGFLEQRALIGQFSFHEALAVAVRRTQGAGYTIELVEVEPEDQIEESLRKLARRTVDGFLLLGWPAPAAARALRFLKRKGLAGAALGNRLDDDDLTWSDVDRAGAIRQATQLLISEGHDRIALLDLDVGGSYREIKLKAFLDAVQEGSGSKAADRVFTMREPGLEETVQMTHRALDQLAGLQAFILSDNFLADAVMLALRQRGIRPGRDFRLIGIGDSYLASRTRPRLTHYSLMVPQQAAFVVDALLDQVRDASGFTARHRLFESVLIDGET